MQKTCTEDFMTGKKAKNVGQRNQYYVKDSHPAIVSDEMFDKVQEEMVRRARVVHKDDGTVESKAGKYNGKYLLGNVLVCGNCGGTYRRRTERGKVVWRCATRIESGKNMCADSPTLKEDEIREVLGDIVCENGIYCEETIRNNIEKILIFNSYLEVCYKNQGKDNFKLFWNK